MTGKLNGRKLRVIVVEDEAIIAMMLEELLEELGCTVVGVAGRVDDALQLISSTPCDAAVLDVNLGGTTIAPVALRLEERSIPFCFITGYGQSPLMERLPSAPCIGKPIDMKALRRVLGSLAVRAGVA